MKTINKEYIKQFNPCDDRWKNYIKHYSDFNGTIIEFLELDKITWHDKKWVLFHEEQELLSDKLLREFGLICASRAVDRVDIDELNYFHMLNILMYESGQNLKDYAAWNAARYSARCAAWNATRGSASRAAWNATRHAVLGAAWNAALDSARHAARYAAWNATSHAARYAAWDFEGNIQRDILINLIEKYKVSRR